MVSVHSLKNRYLKVIGDSNNGIIYYLNQVVDADLEQHPGQLLYNTPDACLQAIYDHAYTHHYRQIKVGIFAIFFETDQNDVVGYTFRESRGILTSHDLDGVSFMWMIENGFGGGEKVMLHYPQPKPELEILNYLWFNADQWCKSNGYADLQEHSDSLRYKFMHDTVNVPFDPGEDNILILRRQYAEAGYDVSHLGEVEYTDNGELYLTRQQDNECI